ncbi:MAG: hypothetical protein Q4B13_01550 [Lautropia sp.]|nr:hypothetical protein [Lautropia sp.]
MSKKERIRFVFEHVIGSDHLDESLIHQYFARDYVQKVDGKELDLDGLIKHLSVQKRHISQAKTEFLALVEEGLDVFSNHIVRAVKTDGRRVAVQVLAQFRFDAQDKIVLCDELTRLLEGDRADADLGSRC